MSMSPLGANSNNLNTNRSNPFAVPASQNQFKTGNSGTAGAASNPFALPSKGDTTSFSNKSVVNASTPGETTAPDNQTQITMLLTQAVSALALTVKTLSTQLQQFMGGQPGSTHTPEHPVEDPHAVEGAPHKAVTPHGKTPIPQSSCLTPAVPETTTPPETPTH